jgi:hypothetical protein
VTERYPTYPAYASGWGEAAPPPPAAPSTADAGTRGDLRAAAFVVLALTVLGALLGLAWSAWSGPQQRAFVIAPGKLYPFEEVETMAAADGRFLVLTGAVGLAAGLLAWFRLREHRGPIMALALVIGGLAGAALTWWVGYLTDGGTYSGRKGTTIAHLPLTLHMHGLLLLEAALAALVYGLFSAFAVRDDLGRDDPVRSRASVQRGEQTQRGGGDGDAAGAAQQGYLPPQ